MIHISIIKHSHISKKVVANKRLNEATEVAGDINVIILNTRSKLI